MAAPTRLFDWDDAIPGLRSDGFVARVTVDSIRAYVAATGDALPGLSGSTAPPGYIFVAAPQRRHALMAEIGRHAPEQDPSRPRSTPYVGSDVRFWREIAAGDEIHSRTVLDRKFERRGSRFVVFRVEAKDRRGESVAEYGYTCLWERDDVVASPAGPARATRPAWRADPAFPVLEKQETDETIAAYGALPVGRAADWMSTHTNEQFARTAIFGGAVNVGVATAAYTVQWLDLLVTPGSLWGGGRLESRALAPIRAGDVLRITGRRLENEGVAYEIAVVNQDDVLAFRSIATLPPGTP